MDLALNNLQRLIWHKTQQTKPNQPNLSNAQFVCVCDFNHWFTFHVSVWLQLLGLVTYQPSWVI